MIRHIKYYFLLSLLMLLNLVLGNDAFAAKKSAVQPLDGIVVIINDAIITQSELDEAVKRATKQLAGMHTVLPSPSILQKQVLDQLINRKVQLQLAEQAGIHVPDTEVTQAINRIATANHITLSELYEKVIAMQGMTLDDYRKEIREEIMLQRVQEQEVGTKIKMTPDEVNDFMHSKEWLASNGKEYHLEDILIPVPEAPSSQDLAKAKKRAEAIVSQLHQGMNFNTIAVAESSSSQALSGGDLGWRKLPEVPSIFANQILNMKTNDILGPVQAPNGFHIIHLAGIRNAAKNSSQLQEKQVQQLVFERKFEEALQNWITKIRAEAVIHYQ